MVWRAITVRRCRCARATVEEKMGGSVGRWTGGRVCAAVGVCVGHAGGNTGGAKHSGGDVCYDVGDGGGGEVDGDGYIAAAAASAKVGPSTDS